MRFVLAAVMAVACLLPTTAEAQLGGGFSTSGYAFSTSNSISGESMGSGNTAAADGYAGTFSYNYSVGAGGASYVMWYSVAVYDPGTEQWSVYGQDYYAASVSANTTGTVYWDFFAGSGFPSGIYQLSAWLCTVDGDGVVTQVYGGAEDTDALVFSAGDDTDPLPMPEPDPGPEPGGPSPLPLPESGPIGPGSSIVRSHPRGN
jgi:hypothetical protein